MKKCIVCNIIFMNDDYSGAIVENDKEKYIIAEMNYCPFCGAQLEDAEV